MTKDISLVGLYRLLRPANYPGEDWLEHRAGWLSNILVNIAPELDIRESAMNKAEDWVYKCPGNKPIPVRPDLESAWAKRLKSLLKIQAPETSEPTSTLPS